MDSGERHSHMIYEYVFPDSRQGTVYVRAFQPLLSKQFEHFEQAYGKCSDINKFEEEILVDNKTDIRIERRVI